MIGRKRTYEEACEDHKEIDPPKVTTNTITTQPQQTFSKQLLQIYYGISFALASNMHFKKNKNAKRPIISISRHVFEEFAKRKDSNIQK